MIQGLTKPQKHALMLLEIQDAKRGWVRYITLKSCGVMLITLLRLEVKDLVVCDGIGVKPDESRWRLTAKGENRAREMKTIRKTEGRP